MANFKELNINLDVILQKLLANNNLCNLINYNTVDALSQDNLEDSSELLYTKIFPYPCDTKVLNEASSILIVGFDNFKAVGTSFVGNILYFRILCHQSLYKLNEGLRPYHIAHEIASLFNNQRVVGIGKILFSSCGEIREGDYYGFELAYKITEFS